VPGLLAITPGETASFLIEVGVVLMALALLARLAARTGFSAVPLYLLAGLVLSAIAPRQLDEQVVQIETQIAVILLLFMLGLEYTGNEVTRSLRSGLVAGVADIVLNFTPGFAFALLLGWDALTAVLLGGVTYISSSSIVAKVLDDLGRLGNTETPGVLSVLVLEDLVMAAYLPLVAVLLAGGTLIAALASSAAATGLAGLALVIAARHGHRLSAPLHHPKSEVVLLTVVGLLLVAGGVAELVGVSAGVVAFLVGLMISGTLARRARELLSPLRDLFAAIFFVSFGLQIDIGKVPGVIGIACLLAVVTAAGKIGTGWLAARRSSAVPGRVRAGTVLITRGEFSIVIAGLGVAVAVEDRLGPLAATYVLITAIAGPLITRYADSVARLGRRRAGEARAPLSSP
jgi:CPA2 family monovalent cation:H+ antiporter-2